MHPGHKFSGLVQDIREGNRIALCVLSDGNLGEREAVRQFLHGSPRVGRCDLRLRRSRADAGDRFVLSLEFDGLDGVVTTIALIPGRD